MRREALRFRALLPQLRFPLAVRLGLSASRSAPGSRLDFPGSPERAFLADPLAAEAGIAGVNRGMRVRVRAILGMEGTDEPPSLP